MSPGIATWPLGDTVGFGRNHCFRAKLAHSGKPLWEDATCGSAWFKGRPLALGSPNNPHREVPKRLIGSIFGSRQSFSASALLALGAALGPQMVSSLPAMPSRCQEHPIRCDPCHICPLEAESPVGSLWSLRLWSLLPGLIPAADLS